MDKNFFGEQVSRLKSTYASGSLSNERVQVLWDRFKGVENRVFENAVNYLISEYTSLTLPAMSKFAEAVGMFRTSVSAKMEEFQSAFSCEPCRDFGFGWIGEPVVACTCAKRVSPQELARQQKFYDIGKWMFPMPGKGPVRVAGFTRALPYNPRESVAERDGVRA